MRSVLIFVFIAAGCLALPVSVPNFYFDELLSAAVAEYATGHSGRTTLPCITVDVNPEGEQRSIPDRHVDGHLVGFPEQLKRHSDCRARKTSGQDVEITCWVTLGDLRVVYNDTVTDFKQKKEVDLNANVLNVDGMAVVKIRHSQVSNSAKIQVDLGTLNLLVGEVAHNFPSDEHLDKYHDDVRKHYQDVLAEHLPVFIKNALASALPKVRLPQM